MRALSALPLAAVLAVLASTAGAQDAPPARNGNVWDNRAHEPDPSATNAQERASGVAPSQQQQQSETSEVERLDQQVQQRAQQGPGAAAGCGADGKGCPQR